MGKTGYIRNCPAALGEIVFIIGSSSSLPPSCREHRQLRASVCNFGGDKVLWDARAGHNTKINYYQS